MHLFQHDTSMVKNLIEIIQEMDSIEPIDTQEHVLDDLDDVISSLNGDSKRE